MRLRYIVFAAAIGLAPSLAHAHPHVWVDAAAEVLYDDKGRISAIRHHWRFDESFSAYALQGLDVDRDGNYSPEELAPLAKENAESLKDYDFFSFLSAGNYQAGFLPPKDYYIDLMDDRVVLHLTLPLAMPLLTHATAVLQLGDPEYYVAFSFPSIEAVRLINAPSACRLVVYPARELDPAAAAVLAEIGPDVRDLPEDMEALAAGTENSAEVNCGGPVVGAATAGEAASAMADAGVDRGDLPAAPPSETETRPTATVAEASISPPWSRSQGLLGGWTAWIRGLQTQFNRDLTEGLKAFRDGGAFWWLGGISFLYGIVHAAGPGHGKVVISSYLVANEARIRRGVVIAFISAFAQAVFAVCIIGVLAVILNTTAVVIDSTAKVFEAGSFALVAALGVFLLVRKGGAVWSAIKGGDPHAHHHHGHGHAHEHGHDHGHHATRDPLPPCGGETERGEGHSLGAVERGRGSLHVSPLPNPPPQGGRGLAGAAGAIISVGVRPCTGALIVLVFALSQGIFWAGVAATFVMALGTALTVAALAALAVGAKDIATRLARGGDGRRGAQAMLGLELAAAVLITAMGAVLFVGTISA